VSGLRAARPADAAAVAEVLIVSRRELMPFAPSAHSDEEVRAWVAATLLPGGGVTVAEGEGGVVGILAVTQRSDVAWIEQLFVHPRHVGGGIGSALLAHAMALLTPPVRLYTFQANVRARAFYERRGFVALVFSDGRKNEERCPDVLYEHRHG
jgi:GNAT superfamily N-acetyltransferase